MVAYRVRSVGDWERFIVIPGNAVLQMQTRFADNPAHLQCQNTTKQMADTDLSSDLCTLFFVDVFIFFMDGILRSLVIDPVRSVDQLEDFGIR